MKDNVIRLVRPVMVDDLVHCLQDRLAEARRADLIGIAYVGMYRTHEYAIDVAGETKRAPALTRGMLLELDWELAQILRRR